MRRQPRPRNHHLVAAIAQTGLTQLTIAARAGLSPMTLSRLVNQRQEPLPETAARLAQVLHTTPAALGFAPQEVTR